MGFDVHSEIANGIVRITLSGELDAKASPTVMNLLSSLDKTAIKRLVFFTDRLTYISSAGLRAILFARQKLNVDIYWIAPTESVLDTIQLAGFDQVVKIRDHYNAAEIETA
jgi:anti-anti-sigma factor